MANKVIQVVAKKASFVLAKAVQPGVAWEILHFDLEAISLLKSMASIDDDTLALPEAGVRETLQTDDAEPMSLSSSEDEEGSEVSEKLSKKQVPKRSGKRLLFRFGRMKGKARSASRKQALDVKLPLEIFQEALRSKKWEAAQALLEGSFTIYFTDTGGQLEFQELLPALTSGPSVFFLVFRISDSLHETYRVEYVRPTSEKSASYATSFTLKEALMQSLASISSICSYSSRKSKTMVMIRSKVILVGTHSDKASAEHIQSVQRELKEILQNTDYYKKGIIAFSSRDEPVVVVNNLAEADIHNQKIRSIVENIAKDPCYQVSTPAPWYVLALALRSLSVPVVSMEQCLSIAEDCGISDEEELKEALWFLHTKLGLLRYFGEIEELSAIVICNPQLLFEKVTDLITSTFTFEETNDPYGEEKFKKLGIISKELIERILATDNSILTCKHLLVLLEHIDIVAPIRNDAGEIIEYFMPSALSHAEEAPPSQSSSTIPQLLVLFKCGYVPKGLSSALHVQLQSNKHTPKSMQWKLLVAGLSRKIVTFHVGPTRLVLVIRSCISHLEITLKPSTAKVSSELLKSKPDTVCTPIRETLEASINAAFRTLHYTVDQSFSFGFYCTHPSCFKKDQHPAECDDVDPEVMDCKVNGPWDLTPHHQTWFGHPIPVSSYPRPELTNVSPQALPPCAKLLSDLDLTHVKLGGNPECFNL